MTSSMNWNPGPAIRLIQQAMAAGLNAGAVQLQGYMKSNMGRHGGGVIGKTKTGRNKYRAAPPGAYPGVRTGNLRRSIGMIPATPNLLRAYAGTVRNITGEGASTNQYAAWLEFGTRKMRARPWAMRSLRENQRKILATMTSTMRRVMALQGVPRRSDGPKGGA